MSISKRSETILVVAMADKGAAKEIIASLNSTGSTASGVNTVNSRSGDVLLSASDVGLANANNTSDVNKPVSTPQAAANSAVQAFSIQRANHTGTQVAATISDFTAAATAAAPVQSVASRTGSVVLTSSDVGLANANNTSDVNKPISTATQTALNLKAPLASPTLTGTPSAPTATLGTNTTQLATTAFVAAATAAAGSTPTVASYGVLALAGASTPTNTPLNFEQVITDTGGRVTTGAAWKFTALVAGNYAVTGSVTPYSGGDALKLFKNNTTYAYIGIFRASSSSAFSTVILLAAGDFIDLRCDAPVIMQPQSAGSYFNTVNVYLIK